MENREWLECLSGWRSLEQKIANGEYGCPITALVSGSTGSLAVAITAIAISHGEKPEVSIFQSGGDPIVLNEHEVYRFKVGRDAEGKPIFLTTFE